MSNILLLVFCFIIGILARRIRKFPENSHTTLNSFIIYVSLPATVFYYIPGLKLTGSLFLAAAMPWIVFAAGFVYFLTISKFLPVKTKSMGALILACGLGNTSFIGIPMIEAYFGKELIGMGVVTDQPGSFLALSTVGILSAVRFSSGSIQPKDLLKRIFSFPPFIAMVIAFLFTGQKFPDVIEGVLLRLSDSLAPLALLSVGFQLHFRAIKGRFLPLFLGLFFKLILAPVMIYVLYRWVFLVKGDVFKISVFEAAMGPMITAGIIAIDHDLDPPLITLLFGIGIPLSFLTLPIWAAILSF